MKSSRAGMTSSEKKQPKGQDSVVFRWSKAFRLYEVLFARGLLETEQNIKIYTKEYLLEHLLNFFESYSKQKNPNATASEYFLLYLEAKYKNISSVKKVANDLGLSVNYHAFQSQEINFYYEVFNQRKPYMRDVSNFLRCRKIIRDFYPTKYFIDEVILAPEIWTTLIRRIFKDHASSEITEKFRDKIKGLAKAKALEALNDKIRNSGRSPSRNDSFSFNQPLSLNVEAVFFIVLCLGEFNLLARSSPPKETKGNISRDNTIEKFNVDINTSGFFTLGKNTSKEENSNILGVSELKRDVEEYERTLSGKKQMPVPRMFYNASTPDHKIIVETNYSKEPVSKEYYEYEALRKERIETKQELAKVTIEKREAKEKLLETMANFDELAVNYLKVEEFLKEMQNDFATLITAVKSQDQNTFNKLNMEFIENFVLSRPTDPVNPSIKEIMILKKKYDKLDSLKNRTESKLTKINPISFNFSQKIFKEDPELEIIKQPINKNFNKLQKKIDFEFPATYKNQDELKNQTKTYLLNLYSYALEQLDEDLPSEESSRRSSFVKDKLRQSYGKDANLQMAHNILNTIYVNKNVGKNPSSSSLREKKYYRYDASSPDREKTDFERSLLDVRAKNISPERSRSPSEYKSPNIKKSARKSPSPDFSRYSPSEESAILEAQLRSSPIRYSRNGSSPENLKLNISSDSVSLNPPSRNSYRPSKPTNSSDNQKKLQNIENKIILDGLNNPYSRNPSSTSVQKDNNNPKIIDIKKEIQTIIDESTQAPKESVKQEKPIEKPQEVPQQDLKIIEEEKSSQAQTEKDHFSSNPSQSQDSRIMNTKDVQSTKSEAQPQEKEISKPSDFASEKQVENIQKDPILPQTNESSKSELAKKQNHEISSIKNEKIDKIEKESSVQESKIISPIVQTKSNLAPPPINLLKLSKSEDLAKPDLKKENNTSNDQVQPKQEIKPKIEVETETKPEVPVEIKTTVKTEINTEVKPEVKPEVKVEVKPEVKDVKSEVKVENESEFKSEVKVEVKPEVKLEVKPEAKVEVKPEAKVEFKPEFKVEKKPEVKTEVKNEVKIEAKPEVKSELKTEVNKVIESSPEKTIKADAIEIKTPEILKSSTLDQSPDILLNKSLDIKPNSLTTSPVKIVSSSTIENNTSSINVGVKSSQAKAENIIVPPKEEAKTVIIEQQSTQADKSLGIKAENVVVPPKNTTPVKKEEKPMEYYSLNESPEKNSSPAPGTSNQKTEFKAPLLNPNPVSKSETILNYQPIGKSSLPPPGLNLLQGLIQTSTTEVPPQTSVSKSEPKQETKSVSSQPQAQSLPKVEEVKQNTEAKASQKVEPQISNFKPLTSSSFIPPPLNLLPTSETSQSSNPIQIAPDSKVIKNPPIISNDQKNQANISIAKDTATNHSENIPKGPALSIPDSKNQVVAQASSNPVISNFQPLVSKSFEPAPVGLIPTLTSNSMGVTSQNSNPPVIQNETKPQIQQNPVQKNTNSQQDAVKISPIRTLESKNFIAPPLNLIPTQVSNQPINNPQTQAESTTQIKIPNDSNPVSTSQINISSQSSNISSAIPDQNKLPPPIPTTSQNIPSGISNFKPLNNSNFMPAPIDLLPPISLQNPSSQTQITSSTIPNPVSTTVVNAQPQISTTKADDQKKDNTATTVPAPGNKAQLAPVEEKKESSSISEQKPSSNNNTEKGREESPSKTTVDTSGSDAKTQQQQPVEQPKPKIMGIPKFKPPTLKKD